MAAGTFVSTHSGADSTGSGLFTLLQGRYQFQAGELVEATPTPDSNARVTEYGQASTMAEFMQVLSEIDL